MSLSFTLHFEILSHPTYLRFLNRFFFALAKVPSLRLKPPHPFRLTQILVEAYNNAVFHAHRCVAKKWIGVCVKFYYPHVILEIVDRGSGYNIGNLKSSGNPWRASGRGLAIISGYAKKMWMQRVKGKNILKVHYEYGK